MAPMGIYVCAIFGEFKAIFDLVTRTQKKEGEKKKNGGMDFFPDFYAT